MAWSIDHLKIIDKMQRAVSEGGLFALAMPRGSGKTTLCECAALWAILTGRRRFVFLIAAAEGQALQILENLQKELSTNEGLAEDFPEAVYPIRALEGEARRCKGQRHHGRRTGIVWGKTRITLAQIPGSPAAGATIRVAGLTGNLRGANVTLADGSSIRPDLAIIDDPQTDQSARSLAQTAQREAIVSGAILGLAGPRKKIAAVMPCTVIACDDLADRLLDRKKHPEWAGERTKTLYAFPAATDLWDHYAELRRGELANDGDGSEATAFYRAHREAMDAGAIVAWPQRHNADELSGLQRAMNEFYRDPAAFAAEHQNDPPRDETSRHTLTADAIAARLSGLPRGELSTATEYCTAFVDCHEKILYWAVAGFRPDFSGSIIDYGSWPEQAGRHFSAAHPRKTLAHLYRQQSTEGRLEAGVLEILEHLNRKEYPRRDGTSLRVWLTLVDAGWLTDTVFAAIARSPHAARTIPSFGRSFRAAHAPLGSRMKKGERIGHHWLLGPNERRQRHTIIDANYWKSFLLARLNTPIGDPGALSLYGSRADEHRLFAEHLTAEYPIRVQAQGREVDEWQHAVGSPDNHFLDCTVGCLVAASMLGAKLSPIGDTAQKLAAAAKKRNRVSYL